MKEKTVNLFGVHGTGPTVKEAKADAGRKLEALVAHAPEPVIISHPNYAAFALVFRCGVSSFSYTVLWPANSNDGTYNNMKAGRVYGCSICDSEATAIRSATRHLAQMACSVNDDDTSGLEFFKPLTCDYTDEQRTDAKEHLWWLAWQREYARIQKEHPELSTTTIHRQASESPTRDSLVAKLKARFGL